jgi:hypothetical protein
MSLHVGGVRHTVGKFSMRATTLLKISFQSEVWTQSYEPPKSKGPQPLGNFGTFICESWDKMTFGCWPCGQAKNIL